MTKAKTTATTYHGPKAYANERWEKKLGTLTGQERALMDRMQQYKNDVYGKWRKRKGRGSAICGLKPDMKFMRGEDGEYRWHVWENGGWVPEPEKRKKRKTA